MLPIPYCLLMVSVFALLMEPVGHKIWALHHKAKVGYEDRYHLPLASLAPTLKGRMKFDKLDSRGKGDKGTLTLSQEIDIRFNARGLVVGVVDDLDTLKVVHDD